MSLVKCFAFLVVARFQNHTQARKSEDYFKSLLKTWMQHTRELYRVRVGVGVELKITILVSKNNTRPVSFIWPRLFTPTNPIICSYVTYRLDNRDWETGLRCLKVHKPLFSIFSLTLFPPFQTYFRHHTWGMVQSFGLFSLDHAPLLPLRTFGPRGGWLMVWIVEHWKPVNLNNEKQGQAKPCKGVTNLEKKLNGIFLFPRP